MSNKDKKLPINLASAGLTSVAGVAIVFGIVVAINLLGSALNFRIDLTEDKLYTLSDGTRRILRDLDTPVTIRFYVSDDTTAMPQDLKNLARRVEDFLLEYKKASKGKVRVEKFRVRRDTDEEDSAALDGIRPSGGGILGLGREPIYFGISVRCLDKKLAIPFVPSRPETLLEYDLSRAITMVVDFDKPRIAVMTSIEVAGGMDMQNLQAGPKPAWIFYNELKKDYEVSIIGPNVEKIVVGGAPGTDEADAELAPDLLLVYHPFDIGPAGEYAIDQYLLGGGKVIALLDPMFFTSRFLSRAAPGPMMPPPPIGAVSTFENLLGAWGVEFDSTKVVADMDYRTPLRGGIVSPTVLSLGPAAINAEDPSTAQIQDASFVFSGGFVTDPAEGLELVTLLKSSKNNQLISPSDAEPGPGFQKTIDNFVPSGVDRAFAIRLSGDFKTAFPEGKPGGEDEAGKSEGDDDDGKDTDDDGKDTDDDGKDADDDEKDADDDGKEKKGSSLTKSEKPGVVILFGDADFVYDQFSVQQQNLMGQVLIMPLNGNLTLLQNTVEQLSGDANLINVRSRSSARRPFTKINEMESAAEQKFSAKIQELENDLQETQLRLNEFQATKDENDKFVLSPEQQAEIESVNKRVAEKNRELRQVRKDLRRDIDSMVARIKFMNILLMPLIVIVVGVGLAMARRSKRAAR